VVARRHVPLGRQLQQLINRDPDASYVRVHARARPPGRRGAWLGL
jgi:hypothetical protein